MTDFGLVKVLADSDSGLTKTGSMMGTMPYMAPEQALGTKEIDARADVFALGVMIWRIQTGGLPVDPQNIVAVGSFYGGQQEAEVLSGRLGPAVAQAMSVELGKRPTTAEDLLGRLSVQNDSVSKALGSIPEREAPPLQQEPPPVQNEATAVAERAVRDSPIGTKTPLSQSLGRPWVWVLLALFGLGIWALVTQSSSDSDDGAEVEWLTDENAVLAAAERTGKPVMVNFTADWCAPCKKLDEETFSDGSVFAMSYLFERLEIDGTKTSKRLERLKERFNVQGFPTVAFLMPDGSPIEEFKLEKFEGPNRFKLRMKKVLDLVRTSTDGLSEAEKDQLTAFGYIGDDGFPKKTDNQRPARVKVRAERGRLLVDFEQQEGWFLTQVMTYIELDKDQALCDFRQHWPTAHQRPDPALQGMTRGEYDGDFTVLVELTGQPHSGRFDVKGLVVYQSCRQERCLLPESLEFELSVEMPLGPPPGERPSCSHPRSEAATPTGE